MFLLFFLFFIIVIIFTLERWSFTQMAPKEIISSVIGFVTIIGLLIVGLMNGIKKIKKDKIVKAIDYAGTLDIKLNGRISYTDYQKLILGLSFKKPVYLVFICLIILLLLAIINNDRESNQTYLNIFPFLILGFLLSPILTVIQIKKIYRTNSIFQEHLDYKLTNDSIHIKGNTVDSIQKWTHFYKVKETRGFFMFYQGEGIATLLDKKMFSDNELANFKQFIRSLKFDR